MKDRLTKKDKATLQAILYKLMAVDVHCPKLRIDRADSFWYFSQDKIATVSLMGIEVSVEIGGQIKMSFPDENNNYVDGGAVHEALNRKMGDSDLAKLYKNGNFSANNWFQLLIDDDGYSHSAGESGHYDNAIEMAKEALFNEIFEKLTE